MASPSGSGAVNSDVPRLTAQLRFVEGDSRIVQRVIDLHESNVKVGRGQDCDVIWGSMLISREHAIFEYLQSIWYIRNTSRNGVFVNGNCVTRGELQKLNENDVINFTPPDEGGVVAKYRFRHVRNTGADSDGQVTTMNQGSESANEATPEAVMSVMNDELACAVCSDVFIEATTIDCGHTFCHFCIHHWTEKGNKNCPICRRPVKQRLIRNVEICNFISRMYTLYPEEVKMDRQKALKEREEVVKKRKDEAEAKKGSAVGYSRQIQMAVEMGGPAGRGRGAGHGIIRRELPAPRPSVRSLAMSSPSTEDASVVVLSDDSNM